MLARFRFSELPKGPGTSRGPRRVPVENRSAEVSPKKAGTTHGPCVRACLTESRVRVATIRDPCVREAAEASADQVRVVADEEIAEEDVGMGDPELEIVVAFAVDDFPAGIAVRMTGEGVDLDRDFF